MGKSAPKAPTPPDPTTVIGAQSAANSDSARLQSSLNNVNYSGPEGTVAYSQDTPDRWTQHVQLTPTAQATFDMDQNAQYRAAKTADQQMLRVGDALGQNLGQPNFQTSAPIGQLQDSYNNGGKIDYGFNPGGPITSGFGSAGQLQTDIGPTYSPFPGTMPGPAYSQGGMGSSAQGGPAPVQHQGPFLSGPTQAPPGVGGGPAPAQHQGSFLSGPTQAPAGVGGSPGPGAAPGAPPPANSLAARVAQAQQPGHAHALAQLTQQYGAPAIQAAMHPQAQAPQPQPGPQQLPGPAPVQGGGQQGQGQGQPQLAGLNQGYPSQMAAIASNPVAATQWGEYQQATSRLDPQWQQASEQQQAALAAQGLTPGSTAYNNAMQIFNNSKNDAYNQAIYGAIGAGNSEQQNLFGQALNTGQFHNQTQQQNYDQLMGRANLQNSSQLQQYGENQGLAQMNNTAQLQANTENLQAAQQHNQTLGQNWQEQYANAGLNNSSQQQAFSDRAYAQTLPINEFSGLMSQSQVGMPTSMPAQNTQVAPTDALGAYSLNSSAAERNYEQQMQNYQSGLNGLYNLGGSALAAFAHSDIRLKRDVTKLGERPDGLGVYRFRYRGHPGWHVGVMAQEVQRTRPELVGEMHGFLTVNYRGL